MVRKPASAFDLNPGGQEAKGGPGRAARGAGEARARRRAPTGGFGAWEAHEAQIDPRVDPRVSSGFSAADVEETLSRVFHGSDGATAGRGAVPKSEL